MTEPDSTSPNPYEPPLVKVDGAPGPTPGQTMVLVLLGLLVLPAAGVMFFGTCLGTILVVSGQRGPGDGELTLALLTATIVGAATLGLGIYWIMRLARRWRKPNEV